MKSYIQGMFKSSFTALGLEVRDLIEDRFTKLEQTILSSQTPVGVLALYSASWSCSDLYSDSWSCSGLYSYSCCCYDIYSYSCCCYDIYSSSYSYSSVYSRLVVLLATSRARASRDKASPGSFSHWWSCNCC
ncbi:unnamed protein product [Brassica rapa]|uniref:Uncharacterized protein n=1 Tax=Brassica campestris TaxID=3711 RepID=A0A8D9LSG3_BRACM|nr:unnamed protein product [Brassica rapa]